MTTIFGRPADRQDVRASRSSDQSKAALLASRGQDGVELVLSGAWDLENAASLESQLNQISSDMDPQPGRVTFDFAQVDRLDTAGAWLVKRTADRLIDAGHNAAFVQISADRRALIESVANCQPDSDLLRDRAPLWIEITERTGAATLSVVDEVAKLTAFFGLIMVRLAGLIRHPSRIRTTSVLFHMEATGLNAIPIVALLSFLVGVVIAYQGALQLRQFGAEVFTIDLLGFSVLRELGVLITSIIVAGRSGSAFAAQIGTMKVSEEVDAMKTIGLDTIDYLVLPRILALVITLPMLVFLADLVALLGGAAISKLVLDVEFGIFLRRLRDSVDLVQLSVGLIKAPVFAFAIAMAGCYEGLKVSGSAQSVGERTTAAVVESIFLVIVLDAAFSILFAFLGI